MRSRLDSSEANLLGVPTLTLPPSKKRARPSAEIDDDKLDAAVRRFVVALLLLQVLANDALVQVQ